MRRSKWRAVCGLWGIALTTYPRADEMHHRLWDGASQHGLLLKINTVIGVAPAGWECEQAFAEAPGRWWIIRRHEWRW